MAQIHDLKILPEYYAAVDKGVKTYELRFDDRNYAVGDMLILRESMPYREVAGLLTDIGVSVSVLHILDLSRCSGSFSFRSLKNFQ